MSVDPVALDGKTGDNFNRYWYANNNPYRFTDPDGRWSTGTRLCLNDRQLKIRLDSLSATSSKIPHKSEGAAAKYFSDKANPLQRQSGQEIGANMEQRTGSDFRVIDFHSDGSATGTNGVSTLAYDGMFTWKGIMHTHSGNRSFSGLGVYGQQGRYYGLYTSSDAQQAVSHGVNNYLSTADGKTFKLDFERMSRDVTQNSNNSIKIFADSYVEEL